jgi:hypothetical protein
MRLFITILCIITAFIFGYITATNEGDIRALDNRFLSQDNRASHAATVYNSDHGFSFSYPAELSLENTQISIPGEENIAAVGVMRYVHAEWCPNGSNAKDCTKLLENPGIAFGVHDKSRAVLIGSQMAVVNPFFEPVTVGTHEGQQYFIESKGEGIVTLLFDLKDKKTLIVQYTYDDFSDHEDIQQHQDVLNQTEQKRFIDQILTTLTIE